MDHPPIPVICDRCRSQGEAGAGDFADLAGLLDFEPVPRRPRANGWSAEVQRAFIAALAVTGSPRQAAKVVGRAQFGADQLRKAKGAEGFNAAWDGAMTLSREKGRRRLNASLAAALPAPPPAEPDPDDPDDPDAAEIRDRLAFLDSILRQYVMKLTAEREARLAGQIVAADFYVRQLTHIEVIVDLMEGGAGFRTFMDFKFEGRDLVHIAETPFSRLLDDTRREFWERTGQPAGPRETARDLLIDLGVISVPRGEETWGGQEVSHAEQESAFRERHAADAAAQMEWEAEARRDYEARREASQPHRQEPGSAGQPAPEGRQD